MTSFDLVQETVTTKNNELKEKVNELNKIYLFHNFKIKQSFQYTPVKSFDDCNNYFKKETILIDNINITQFIKVACLNFHNDLFDDNAWLKITTKNKDILQNLELSDLEYHVLDILDNNFYLINSITCDKVNSHYLTQFKDIMYKQYNNIDIELYEYDDSNNGCNFYWIVIKVKKLI
jgi:hypothetical protein